jgi:Ca2+-binding EF-hand superfamily protein
MCGQEPFEATKLAKRIACIKRMFSFFDADGSGEIDIDEYAAVLF